MTQHQSNTDDVPVSLERLTECRDSAKFWVDKLPIYADQKQFWADFWSIMAGFLAAITGLSVFPVLDSGSGALAKFIVSVVALASAVSALMPRLKNYGELAGSARVLAPQYGIVYGKLVDLVEDAAVHHPSARTTVAEFNQIKAKKDSLRYLTRWIKERDEEKRQAQAVNCPAPESPAIEFFEEI